RRSRTSRLWDGVRGGRGAAGGVGDGDGVDLRRESLRYDDGRRGRSVRPEIRTEAGAGAQGERYARADCGRAGDRDGWRRRDRDVDVADARAGADGDGDAQADVAARARR